MCIPFCLLLTAVGELNTTSILARRTARAGFDTNLLHFDLECRASIIKQSNLMEGEL